MAEYPDREHFIPLRKNDLMRLLLRDKQLPPAEREPFRRFCRLAGANIHFEYLKKLEDLKDAYAPFDPDADTKPPPPPPAGEREACEDRVFAAFAALMARADFTRLREEEIRQAVRQTPSDWGLHMELDLSVFERLEVYVRGDVVREQSRRSWRGLWRLERRKAPMYRRLALVLKLRPDHRLDPNLDVSRIHFKIFKDVPKADVDMLLPGGRPRITRLDRALILWPLLFGVGLLVYHGVQFLPSWDLNALANVASLSLAAGFCGYAYRSYHSYRNKRQAYVLQLVRSLYFRALDGNAGVLMRLFDEAEEQDCREVYLAYFCLWRFAPPQGWTAEQLDDYVEMYLEGTAGLKVDFEIHGAVEKLERMRVARKEGDFYTALSPDAALEMLGRLCDDYFKEDAETGLTAPPRRPAG